MPIWSIIRPWIYLFRLVSWFVPTQKTRTQDFLNQLKSGPGLWFIIYFAVILAYLLLNQGGSIDIWKAPIWAFRALSMGGFVVFSILDRKRIQERIAGVNLLGVLPIFLAVYLVTANIVTIRPFETVEETMNILSYLALAFLCYVYIDSLIRLRQFIEIIIAAGFLIAFHGLFIFYGALWSGKGTTPLASLFYWHNQAAGFLLLIWPSMLVMFYTLRNRWRTFLILYVFYFTFTAFMLTLSRGAWLAGFVPFLAIPFVLSRKKLMPSEDEAPKLIWILLAVLYVCGWTYYAFFDRHWWWGTWLLGLVPLPIVLFFIMSWRRLVLFVLYFVSALPFIIKYRGRFLQPIIDRWNQLRLDDYSVIGRREFWDIAWKVFLKHPWLGIGFNAFGYYYVHYQTNPQYYTKDPHNVYLRFLVEGGIIGGIVIVSFLVIVVRLLVKALKDNPGQLLTIYRVGLLAGIVGELLHLAIDFDWTFPVLPLLVILETTIVARSYHFVPEEQDLPVEQWESEKIRDAVTLDSGLQTRTKGIFIRPVWIWTTLAGILFVVNVFGFISMNIYENGKVLIENQDQLARDRAAVAQGMSQLQQERFKTQSIESQMDFNAYSNARAAVIREAMNDWRLSLKFNPWNWYPLKDLLNSHLTAAEEFYKAGRTEDTQRLLDSALGYAGRLLKVTPYRPATWYYAGQTEILAGRTRSDPELKGKGLEKILNSIKLDPINIPSYYLGIATFYYDEGQDEEALKYADKLEEIFVPRIEVGGVEQIDFGALRGKSLARQDWVDITETVRQAWQLKSDILLKQGRTDEALTALYNGLNTPLGGGEIVESHYDLGLLQLPFALRIADIQAQKGNWTEVYARAGQAIEIMTKRDMLGSPNSRHIHELYYAAQSHIQTGRPGSSEQTGN
jgi:tetratricopeptide (TPR) repeat protein